MNSERERRNYEELLKLEAIATELSRLADEAVWRWRNAMARADDMKAKRGAK